MTDSRTLKKAPLVSQIFCKAIDNYGDFGVCWRLARQLAEEYDADVTIWLDDFTVLTPWLSAVLPTQGGKFSGTPDGGAGAVAVLPWDHAVPQREGKGPVTLVIEAFACELPATYIKHMLQGPAPLWVNLDYLSAEQWVQECHGLFSMHASGLRKLFFFPGFSPDTGGLLREEGLMARHTSWQSQRDLTRGLVLKELGIPPGILALLESPGSLLISAFTYESPTFISWLEALIKHPAPVILILPAGRLTETLAGELRALDIVAGETARSRHWQPGDSATRGNLHLYIIPFQSQAGYDQILSICDLNLVRGEDSFVRAQWAAVPFLWHIYAQDDAAHLHKLQAFLDLYGRVTEGASGSARPALEALREFWMDWNTGKHCHESWSRFHERLPVLARTTQRWRLELLKQNDLASNLMNFYENQL